MIGWTILIKAKTEDEFMSVESKFFSMKTVDGFRYHSFICVGFCGSLGLHHNTDGIMWALIQGKTFWGGFLYGIHCG